VRPLGTGQCLEVRGQAMSRRPQALRLPALAQLVRIDPAEVLDMPREPWEVEMAQLMGRLSPDNREALLRIARAMAEASAAQETA
jgi:hypothetical protein